MQSPEASFCIKLAYMFSLIVPVSGCADRLLLTSDVPPDRLPCVAGRTLLSGRCAIHACILMKTLLRHVVDRRPVPDAHYTGGGSLVFGLASE